MDEIRRVVNASKFARTFQRPGPYDRYGGGAMFPGRGRGPSSSGFERRYRFDGKPFQSCEPISQGPESAVLNYFIKHREKIFLCSTSMLHSKQTEKGKCEFVGIRKITIYQ